jgi:hypothetical protein
MPFITFTVEGLEDIIGKLNSVQLQDAKMQALQEIGTFMANEMRNNAHVITGRMKGSIRSSVQGDVAVVEVPVEYAIYENRRIGGAKAPHDFADRAAQATLSRGPQIVKTAYDSAVSKL